MKGRRKTFVFVLNVRPLDTTILFKWPKLLIMGWSLSIAKAKLCALINNLLGLKAHAINKKKKDLTTQAVFCG